MASDSGGGSKTPVSTLISRSDRSQPMRAPAASPTSVMSPASAHTKAPSWRGVGPRAVAMVDARRRSWRPGRVVAGGVDEHGADGVAAGSRADVGGVGDQEAVGGGGGELGGDADVAERHGVVLLGASLLQAQLEQ